MTADPTPSRPDDPATDTSGVGAGSSKAPGALRLTRASATWVAVGAGLVLLIMLIVFMLQNSAKVEVRFLGANGRIALGLALLIAAVGGGVVVAIAGIARITQLRINVRQSRRGGVARE